MSRYQCIHGTMREMCLECDQDWHILEQERDRFRAQVAQLTRLAQRLLAQLDNAHVVVLEDDASQVEEAVKALEGRP